jgi:putative acetyltransferase
VVAWLGDKAVGCGVFLPLPAGDSSVAEIKRMYVEPSVRRRGVSRAILMKLEELARRCGYLTARLETGVRQPGAIRLYETAGYRRIKPYGRHVDDPLSICFEKSLVIAAGRDG